MIDNKFPSKEAYYYYKIFRKNFSDLLKPIPYYWMPKWEDVNDPSARLLNN